MSDVLIEDVVDGVLLLTMNRPDQRNAIDLELALAIRDAWERFNADDDLRVAVITGAGTKAFTAGADRYIVGRTGEKYKGYEIHAVTPGVFVTVEKPVIAAVSGWCVGQGLPLMLACDLAVAAENAVFSYPEAKLGLGGTWVPTSLAARIPAKVAMELAFGETIDAARAYDVGLVNAVVPVGEHVDKALEYANRIAARAPIPMKQMKWHIQSFGPQAVADRASSVMDRSLVARGSEDMREGIDALRDKRQPVFKGR